MPMSADTCYNASKLRIFCRYLRPHRRLLILDLACALGIALNALAFPLVSRHALSKVLPAGNERNFIWLMLILLAAILLSAGLQYIVTYWGHLLGVRMEADLRRDLFAHLEKLSFSFFDRHRTGHLMSRVTTDLFEITELAHHGPEDLFIACITLTGSFIAMMLIRWELALVLLGVVPLMVFQCVFARRRMSAASKQVKASAAVINADIENAISGIRVAQAFTNEDYEVEKFNAGNRRYHDAKRGFYGAMASFSSGVELTTQLLNLVVIACGAYWMTRQAMPLTDILTFILYVSAFLSPIRKLVAFFEQYSNGMAGFERFLEVMRIQPEIQDRADALPLPPAVGAIEYQDVGFSYDNQTRVLEHVQLKIEPGSTVALVGPSGGGKTTLCQLLLRFYETDAGRILIDGHDIRTVTLASLRSQIGLVQQDVFLFAASIRENILYGRRDADDAAVMEAARQAQIHDFIMGLEDGYDTLVGERGARLSGGQKQRIALARLFLKNPPILILDEATSALDTATEVLIQQAIDTLSRGRTSLIIAHRLSTVQHADRIVYIDEQGIREQGTHAELLAAGGLYSKLYHAQFHQQTGGNGALI